MLFPNVFTFKGVTDTIKKKKNSQHGPTAVCSYDSQTVQKYCKHFGFFYFGTKDTNDGSQN